MRTNKIFIIIGLVTTVFFTTGCKKYLNVNLSNDMSGNNFWKTKADIEAFTNGTYELLRKSVTRPNLTLGAGNGEFPFFIFSGDFRGAPVLEAASGWGRNYITDIANNNIRRMLNPNGYPTGNNWYAIWNMIRFTQWETFYKVISSANIAFEKIDLAEDPLLTEAQKKAYKAEAVFLRCFAYFLMVRMWGDVPYYTDAFHTAALKRTPMVEVLKNCVADMGAVKDDLPWTYNDPVFVAVRAMRGSAIDLMMHMNMWLASFDAANANTYYEAVDKLGDELETNGGAYELLPLENTGEIFKGRSKEGLFEIPQNANYRESFGWSTFYDHIRYDIVNPNSTSYPYVGYQAAFMEAIYPRDVTDGRLSTWYIGSTIYSGNVQFRMPKFLISTDPNSLDGFGFDASQTVFRYSDALLLHAEACAELKMEAKALEKINKVRTRAKATLLNVTGDELKEQVFYERCRELMGEGHYWYDVVRTRRIIDSKYKFGYKATVEQYKAGCWTWPINESALVNNPQMTLNNYWR